MHFTILYGHWIFSTLSKSWLYRMPQFTLLHLRFFFIMWCLRRLLVLHPSCKEKEPNPLTQELDMSIEGQLTYIFKCDRTTCNLLITIAIFSMLQQWFSKNFHSWSNYTLGALYKPFTISMWIISYHLEQIKYGRWWMRLQGITTINCLHVCIEDALTMNKRSSSQTLLQHHATHFAMLWRPQFFFFCAILILAI